MALLSLLHATHLNIPGLSWAGRPQLMRVRFSLHVTVHISAILAAAFTPSAVFASHASGQVLQAPSP